MPVPDSSIWFDAHLDLAYLAVNGRDMLAPLDREAGPVTPATITLPSLADGKVRAALATIFTELDGSAKGSYPAGDADKAHIAGRAQLEAYLTWQDAGAIAIDLGQILRRDPHVGEVRGGMGVSETRPPSLQSILARAPKRAPLHVGVLVENADPIREPDELPWWVERGVVAIGLTWSKPSRYACGNLSTRTDEDTGLSGIGLEMVDAMDTLGVVHDLAHLSDRAMDELLARTDKPVMNSHSNCRVVHDDAYNRNLRDESIDEIVRRGGVIGLNLCRFFLAPIEGDYRPTIDQTVAHVEHICERAGHRRAVGLGSDMDGGFGAGGLPEGIETPSDLVRILEALSARGWSDDDLAGFAHGNFTRFFLERASRAARASISPA